MRFRSAAAEKSVLTGRSTNVNPFGSTLQRKTSRKSSLTLDSDNDEDDEDYDTAVGRKGPASSRILQTDNDDEDDQYLSPLVDSDSDKRTNRKVEANKENELQDLGNNNKTPNSKPRKRRRSSARFLRLSGRFGNEEDGDGSGEGLLSNGKSNAEQQEQLSEMYRQAIRMNAENKINAGNSWGLRLIENIDKFLGDDENDETHDSQVAGGKLVKKGVKNFGGVDATERRVNFTKASCTLDASVKIYSYRVDDVHLSSYKVLANLNRTDCGSNGFTHDCEFGENDDNETRLPEKKQAVGQRKHSERKTIETLESNVANLNMSKLDAAYDIDPLFHKMSKTFDEGGAKGLLLVNLGVASDGCRIVLDSKEDSVAENVACTSSNNAEEIENENASSRKEVREEGDIDISCLKNKLQEMLLYSPLESLQLVPQLESLRVDFAALESEGFVVDENIKPKSNRYANSEEEEKEAEASIHREALERSRVSLNKSLMGNTSAFKNLFSDNGDDDDDEYGADDFGDGDDDGPEEVALNDFVAMDGHGAGYSSISFKSDSISENLFPSLEQTKSATTLLLDALCTGDAFIGGGTYEYFNADILEKFTTGNMWAGSVHWKKIERIRQKRARQHEDQQTLPRQKKHAEARTSVNLSLESHVGIEALLRKKSSKKDRADPSQLTIAAKQKQRKERNILPLDAGIEVDQLSRLFLLPNATLQSFGNDSGYPRKSVGFAGADAFARVEFDDGDESCYDSGNDGGPGFVFADTKDTFGEMDDFVIGNLDGVRKVDKVEVGYATVAKKVDVRRLKRDLWVELELKTASLSLEDIQDRLSEAKAPDSIDAESKKRLNIGEEKRIVSFKETVQELDGSQSQGDVTLPFYFICILHLANEKGLRLENAEFGLTDFIISRDERSEQAGTVISTSNVTEASANLVAHRVGKSVRKTASYNENAVSDAETSSDEHDSDAESDED